MDGSRALNKKLSSASESEEEDNKRYGLLDPELPHLSEKAIRGEEDHGWCLGREDLCKPSPSCIGVGTVAGILVIFGIIVCFMVVEDRHEEKESLATMLSAAGGMLLIITNYVR